MIVLKLENSWLALILLAVLFIHGCSDPEITTDFLPDTHANDVRQHIEYLASDNMKGRLAGTPQEARSAAYIADHFDTFGLTPASEDGRFYQFFTLEGPMVQAMQIEDHTSRNVIAYVRGTEIPQRWIIVGAHYDGQGEGGFISMDGDNDKKIHNSADDNASGTAGLLELAHYFSKNPVRKSILFIAFSGEELGLLGSRYFVENPVIDMNSVNAMINLDMIGRLQNNTLTIMGTGSSDMWQGLIEEAQSSDSLKIQTVDSGTGASDHAPFYESEIPVLHYFTGTHENYHRSSDTADKINLKGTVLVIDHVAALVRNLSAIDSESISFTETERVERPVMRSDGVRLGVVPDYSWSGNGMKITGVQAETPAKKAGLEAGDVIIKIAGEDVNDIYEYMQQLNKFKPGNQTTVEVLRKGKEIQFTVTF